MILRIFILLLLTAGLAACGQATIDTTAPTLGTEYQVEIFNTSYEPGEIRISAGDTVTWINRDNMNTHTITSFYNYRENNTEYNVIGGTWDSGDLKPGDTFSRAFEQTGIFEYVSLPLYHYHFFAGGLSGKVIVE